MTEPRDPNETLAVDAGDVPTGPGETPKPTIDLGSLGSDSLEVGLAAAFGKNSGPPRSNLVIMRPVVLKEAEGESSLVVKPSSDAIPMREEAGDRYRFDGEIARGGMGAVLRGRDVDLGRDLAIKVLLEKYANRPDVARRFIEEAQIGGQLQHPNVVPIYDIGKFGDRPFFTMKLVKGQTLAAILRERTDPSTERPRLLNIALQVSQAMAYAHAKGVIHRDLKPANIMVGAFGEVQVMDWGLAKVLAEGGIHDEERSSRAHQVPDETTIRTARSTGSHGSFGTDTEAGSVMGTPAYMPPEQAGGDIALVDRRADVFGLGAILCEILTGKPPYVGRSGEEVRRKACIGDLADAHNRLNVCEADRELITLTKKCLAPEPIDRLKDAQGLVDALTAYLDGVESRLRQAELDRVEERSRRRLTTLAAAAIIFFGMCGGTGYLWFEQQRSERVAKTARAVDEALADAARLRGEAQAAAPGETAKWAEATSAAKRAEALLAQGEADAPLNNRVAALLAQLDRDQAAAAEKARQFEVDRVLLADLEVVRGQRIDQTDRKVTDAEYAAAFRKAGLDLVKTEPAEAAKWLLSRSEPLELTYYLDDWAYVLIKGDFPAEDVQRILATARAADPDPWRDALRARAGSKDEAAITEFRRLADDQKALETQPSQSLYLLARQLKMSADDRERAAAVMRQAVRRDPGDFWARVGLSTAYTPETDNAELLYPRPEEALRHLTAAIALRPKSAGLRLHLGSILREQAKFDEALAEDLEAIRLKPDYPEGLVHLGLDYLGLDRVDEAIVNYKKAIRLKPELWVAHNNLGSVLMEFGKYREAIPNLVEAIRLNPDALVSRTNLAIGLASVNKGNEAINVAQESIRRHPQDPTGHMVLGLALNASGRLEDSLIAYRKAIQLKPNFADAYNNLGNALQEKGLYLEAEAAQRKAIALKPDSTMYINILGNTLRLQGRLEEATTLIREAIRLNPIGAKSGNRKRREAADSHNKLGMILRDQSRHDEAMAEFLAGIAIDPDYFANHANLAGSFFLQKKYSDAISEYNASIALNPTAAVAYIGLGEVLDAVGKPAEAMKEFTEALRLAPNNVDFRIRFCRVLLKRGKRDEALAELQTAVRLNPNLPNAHADLGNLLRQLGKPSEALAAYRQAIRLKNNSDIVHNGLGSALADLGQFEEAIKEFRTAISLNPNYAQPHANLSLALWNLNRFDEAIEASLEALRIMPEEPFVNNNLASYLVMHPAPAKRNIPEALKFAMKATSLEPDDGNSQNTLGTVQYRAGHLEEAVAAFDKSMKLRKGGDPFDWFFLAMIEHDKGHAKEAADWFEKSVAWMKDQNSKDKDLLQIWTEAAEKLGRPGPDIKNPSSSIPK